MPFGPTIWTRLSSSPPRSRGASDAWFLANEFARSSARRPRAASRWETSWRRWTSTIAIPVRTSTAATATVERSVTRARNVPLRRSWMRMGPSAAIFRHPIARAAHGLDGAAPVRLVDLATQAPDVDLDDVGVALEVVVPHASQDLLLGEDLPCSSDEELEHLELPCGDRDLLLAAPHAARQGVHAEIAHPDRRRVATRATE